MCFVSSKHGGQHECQHRNTLLGSPRPIHALESEPSNGPSLLPPDILGPILRPTKVHQELFFFFFFFFNLNMERIKKKEMNNRGRRKQKRLTRVDDKTVKERGKDKGTYTEDGQGCRRALTTTLSCPPFFFFFFF